MSHGVAINTRIAGAAQGVFRDDLTTLGQWPAPDAIRRITQVAVSTGAIIDSVKITYDTRSGPQTVTHGGPGGLPSLSFVLAANQTITAVYGRRLDSSTLYGTHNIVQLSFVIATTDSDASGNPPSVSLQTVSGGSVTAANTQFQFTWPLAGATPYTDQPSGQSSSFLQGIGFTELFAQADGPL